ncbi:HET-domain-containing protein [Podospora aff. communis PSN243]|uniref:HET-domain-containing protein n=1 Tax=Podospora aff. communis PSN243 TaxID=3040156 RepID=A0AAV9GND2_9PEZI|nr:HET-domain-containing protein [Podospora aff. communis PSN243]
MASRSEHQCPLSPNPWGELASLQDIKEDACSGCDRCLLVRHLADQLLQYPDEDAVFYPPARWGTIQARIHIRAAGAGPEAVYTMFETFHLLVPTGQPKIFAELPSGHAASAMETQKSLSTLKTWIHQCSTQHASCSRSPAGTRLPNRVIKVSGGTIRLIETVKGQVGHYIALSHCWGDSRSPCLTTSATLEANKQRIEWELLPNTFRDAVQVTRELGVQYLWIDSMCIIQDDANDWRIESSNRAHVYKNSYLTLCATRARSDDGGLWLSHEGAGQHDRNVYIQSARDFEIAHLQESRELANGETSNPLLTRAWTLQERLLSPRILHFGHGELLWRCTEMNDCECALGRTGYLETENDSEFDSCQGFVSEKSLAIRLSEASLGKVNIPLEWRCIVEEYTGFSLTLEKDVLPALAGLALEFAGLRPGDRYLAGLWETSLLSDLAWYRASTVKDTPRPSVYRAPSWSWASIARKVGFHSSEFEEDDVRARIISAETTLTGSDTRGEVEGGSIVLMARVQPATTTWVGAAQFDVEVDVEADGGTSAIVCCTYDSISDCQDGAISPGSSVLLLLLQATDFVSSILVLAEALGRPGAFRRVGIDTFEQNPHWNFANPGSGWFSVEMLVEIV